MAVSQFSKLFSSEQAQLLDNIYYLNMGELRQFCDAHGIPYRIHIESKGRVIRTSDCDRKGIVIDRILHLLRTGKIKPNTVFPASVVAVEKLGHDPRESDLVRYGQYKSSDPGIGKLMKRLTDGKFEFGAISQIVIRECWSQGITRRHTANSPGCGSTRLQRTNSLIGSGPILPTWRMAPPVPIGRSSGSKKRPPHSLLSERRFRVSRLSRSGFLAVHSGIVIGRDRAREAI
jgi:hypothetical protein